MNEKDFFDVFIGEPVGDFAAIVEDFADVKNMEISHQKNLHKMAYGTLACFGVGLINGDLEPLYDVVLTALITSYQMGRASAIKD